MWTRSRPQVASFAQNLPPWTFSSKVAASSLRSSSSRIIASAIARPPARSQPLVELDLQGRRPVVQDLLVVGVLDDDLELGIDPRLGPRDLLEQDRAGRPPRLDGGRLL